jgi:hypothetical protein
VRIANNAPARRNALALVTRRKGVSFVKMTKLAGRGEAKMPQGEGLTTEAHRILRLYEMFFSLMFRFMEEYQVKDLGTLMIITTVAIANANEIRPDIETISEETDIPYSTVRRKIEKLVEERVMVARKEAGKTFFTIAGEVNFAHPAQGETSSNSLFQRDVLDIVVKSLGSIILEKKK